MIHPMERKVIPFVTDPGTVRRSREQRTLDAMFALYCRHHHGKEHGLCAGCADLSFYAERRLDRCVFGDAKPTCANCVVHCYNTEMREKIREVMRFAGPRMLFRHPVLGMRHVLDGRRPSPQLPEKPPKAA